ncbi:sensor histidine kinase [Paenibacillus sp. FSL R7-0331]|uniref:sensor histidine kinase n=1 Tax=Paenibacillus sp. FSL R7-0331 TaxID=1536773 RepID=UPI001E516385|nr:HAMP domain-containing sensor histidine kinase [Paenibacillus sp. FSL R7-0331]
MDESSIERNQIYTRRGTITLSASAANGICTVTVADTGEGISAAELPMIFDRFYKVDKARTAGSNSSGLGLSIAQKIVMAHNGTIEAASTVGEGTSFTVTLPHL